MEDFRSASMIINAAVSAWKSDNAHNFLLWGNSLLINAFCHDPLNYCPLRFGE